MSLSLEDRKWGLRPVHHIFELVFMLVCGAVSVPVAFGAVPPPRTMASFLTEPYLTIWAYMLLVGAVVTAAGLLWPWRPVTGLVLEQVGLIVLSGAMILYVWAVIELGVEGVAISIAIIAAFGLASLVRAWQVRVEIGLLVNGVLDSDPGADVDQAIRDRLQEDLGDGEKT